MKRLVAFTLGLLLLVPVLAGCRFNISLGGLAGTRYDVNDVKELDAAGAESIKINTVSDDIIVRSGGDKVRAELIGECRSTSDPVWLDARRDGDALVIEVKYPVAITNCNTVLTVTIPESFAGDFKAGTVSGDVEAQNLPFRLKRVTAATVSGNIGFDSESFDSMRADTTSGAITVSRIAAVVEAHTISGEVTLEYDEFAPTTVTTVSGNVEAVIPQEAAFRVEFGSVSGDFTSTHSGIAVDRAEGGFQAAANGGDTLLKVNTTSGGFKLNGK